MSGFSDFRASLLDPARATPDGLRDGKGRAAGKRYDVYRNNVTHSLIEALETAFPFTHKLIGPSRFAAIAPDFVRAHPPSSPLMMFYGAAFPDFIGSHDATAQIAYLPDAARVDLAMRHSYHAADAAPFDPAVLAVDAEALMALRLPLAPATQIVRSHWPLHDIWRFAHGETSDQPRAIAQDLLITRIDFDPTVHLLPEGAADWLSALSGGARFDEAIGAAPEGFDIESALGLAISAQALAG